MYRFRHSVYFLCNLYRKKKRHRISSLSIEGERLPLLFSLVIESVGSRYRENTERGFSLEIAIKRIERDSVDFLFLSMKGGVIIFLFYREKKEIIERMERETVYSLYTKACQTLSFIVSFQTLCLFSL